MKMEVDRKVLLAPTNAASQISITVRALRRLGIRARGLVLGRSPVVSYDDVDVVSSRFAGPRNIFLSSKWFLKMFKAVSESDVIHWHVGKLILPWKLDLRMVDLLRKSSRFIEWVGSDIRNPEIESEDNPYFRRLIETSKLVDVDRAKERSVKLQRLFESYGFAFIVCEGLVDHVLDDISVPVFKIPVRVDLNELKPSYPCESSRRPLVVHSSTNFLLKGTSYVVDAVKKLREKYDFDFILLSNVERRKALRVMARADVFLDQFILGYYGVAAVEAMALGKPVIGYIKDSLMKRFPRELPIVNASPDELGENLEVLLKDPELRCDLGKKGREYAEKYHDSIKVARRLVDLYLSQGM